MKGGGEKSSLFPWIVERLQDLMGIRWVSSKELGLWLGKIYVMLYYTSLRLVISLRG